MEPIEDILDEAKRLTSGERNNTYGPPTQDFDRTAKMWSAMFGNKLKDGESFALHDVALAMMALKLSRLTWSPNKRDSWVDCAGYARCGAVCAGIQTL